VEESAQAVLGQETACQGADDHVPRKRKIQPNNPDYEDAAQHGNLPKTRVVSHDPSCASFGYKRKTQEKVSADFGLDASDQA
jgi:hypothetical protein